MCVLGTINTITFLMTNVIDVMYDSIGDTCIILLNYVVIGIGIR